jgi:hypothetical protein
VGVAPAFDFPAWHAIAALTFFAAAAAVLVRRGLRAVEVA